MGGFVIIIVIALIIGLGLLAYYQNKRRQEELFAYGQLHGLRFDASQDTSIEEQFPNFKCFQEGHNRYACNLLRGEWNGRPLLTFDYHYETSSSDSEGRSSTQNHDFSAVILSSAVPLQPLFIRPEGFFDKLKTVFGFEDINFESAEFSRTFYVTAPDKKWAYDVIHARMMDHLMAGPRLWLQFDRFQLIAYDGSKTFKVEEFDAAIKLLEGMLDRLPEYLVKQQLAQR